MEEAPMYKGRALKMSNWEPFDIRVKGRALAKVKRALCEKREGRKDLVCDKIKGEVHVITNGVSKRVAVWDAAQAKLKLAGEAKELEKRIEDLIAERHKRDELSD